MSMSVEASVYTAADIMAMLRMKRSTAYRFIQNLPRDMFVDIDGGIRIDRTKFDQYMVERNMTGTLSDQTQRPQTALSTQDQER